MESRWVLARRSPKFHWNASAACWWGAKCGLWRNGRADGDDAWHLPDSALQRKLDRRFLAVQEGFHRIAIYWKCPAEYLARYPREPRQITKQIRPSWILKYTQVGFTQHQLGLGYPSCWIQMGLIQKALLSTWKPCALIWVSQIPRNRLRNPTKILINWKKSGRVGASRQTKTKLGYFCTVGAHLNRKVTEPIRKENSGWISFWPENIQSEDILARTDFPSWNNNQKFFRLDHILSPNLRNKSGSYH